MHKIKIIILFIFLPITASAITCPPDDIDCQTEQLQLQIKKSKGIKPTAIIQAPAISESPEGEKKSGAEITQPQPFQIPKPSYYQPAVTTSTQQDTKLTPPSGVKKSIQSKEKQEERYVPASKTKTQPASPQTTGIIYR